MERFYPQLKDNEKNNILDSFKEELDALKIDTGKEPEKTDYSEDEDFEWENEEIKED
jgi:hypothetical protein